MWLARFLHDQSGGNQSIELAAIIAVVVLIIGAWNALAGVLGGYIGSLPGRLGLR